MGWEKRTVSDAIGIGEREGQSKKASGLLASIRHDQGDNKSTVYELVQKDGESLRVWGSTTMDNKIQPSDVGKFVKIAYLGTETSKRGKEYKNIDVEFYIGDPLPAQLAWPRYNELQNGATTTNEKSDYEEFPEALNDKEEEDDLPF